MSGPADPRTPREPLGPDEHQPPAYPPGPLGSGPSRALIGALAAVLVVLLAILLFVLTRSGGEEASPPPALTASPTEASPSLTPTPSETPTPTPSPTPSPSPSPSPEGPREPTDADAAAFLAEHQPPGTPEDGEVVAADLDGDGRNEVVLAGLADGVVRLEVAAWTGTSYEVVFAGDGGAADQLDGLQVRDITGDGTTQEVVTAQSGTAGEEDRSSMSVWGVPSGPGAEEVAGVADGGFGPMPARGGCWDGSHTYGVIGADVREREIRATCVGTPLPPAAWPTDVYEWDGQAWTFDHREQAGG